MWLLLVHGYYRTLSVGVVGEEPVMMTKGSVIGVGKGPQEEHFASFVHLDCLLVVHVGYWVEELVLVSGYLR